MTKNAQALLWSLRSQYAKGETFTCQNPATSELVKAGKLELEGMTKAANGGFVVTHYHLRMI